MVGIPGRSKACLTCRQRKKRCDLQLPSCKKCIEAGKTCEGYDRYPVFLNRTTQGLAKRKPFEEAKRPQYPVSRPITSTSSIDAPTATQQKRPSCVRKRSIDTVVLQPDNSVACETQLISTFWDPYIPQQSVQDGCHCKWLQQALDLPNPSPALRLSLKALAMARLGWMHRDESLVLDGRVFYSQALQATQRALYDERKMWQDETLATGSVLAFYEFFEPTNHSIAGWNSHMDGAARLMLLRGPDRHRSPFGRALLEGVRLSAMIQALQNRKASPLGNYEWCTRPWIQKRDERYLEKDSTQTLYDYGFTLAALFDEIDTANLRDPETNILLLNKYLRRCSALDATFNLWYQNLARQSSMPLYWLTPPDNGTHHTPSAMTKWWPFSFPDLPAAITMINFWGLKLALSNTIAIICASILSPNHYHQRHDDPQAFAALEHTARPLIAKHGDTGRLETATNIIRAMPYCLHDSTGLFGPHRSLFALRAALLSLRRSPGEELDRCLRAYQELSEKKGVGYAREVGKMNARDSAAAGKTMDAVGLAPGHGE